MKLIKAIFKTIHHLVIHKIEVAKLCIEKGLYIEAITHDLSSFKPKELIPLIKYNLDNKKYISEYSKLADIHCTSNSHHYQYHKINEKGYRMMSFQDIDCMIIDWKANLKDTNVTLEEMFNYNRTDMKLHPTMVEYLKSQLEI